MSDVAPLAPLPGAAEPSAEPERTGAWIPWMFVLGFVIVFIANGIMLTVALNTFNGLSTDGAYDRGLAYNQELADYDAMRAMGWVPVAAFDRAGPTVDGVTDGTASLTLHDAGGQPITRGTVAVEVMRPASQTYDFTVLLPHRGDGRYAAPVTLTLPGVWELRFAVSHPSGDYQLRERIDIR